MRIFLDPPKSVLSGEMAVIRLFPQKCPEKCPFCPLRAEVLNREFKTPIFGIVIIML